MLLCEMWRTFRRDGKTLLNLASLDLSMKAEAVNLLRQVVGRYSSNRKKFFKPIFVTFNLCSKKKKKSNRKLSGFLFSQVAPT